MWLMCTSGGSQWAWAGRAEVSQQGEAFAPLSVSSQVEREVAQPLSPAWAAHTGQTFPRTHAFMCSGLFRNFVLTHCAAQESCELCALIAKLLAEKRTRSARFWTRAEWSRAQSRRRVVVVGVFVREDAGSCWTSAKGSTAVWTRSAPSPTRWREGAQLWSMKPGWRGSGGTGGSRLC